MDARVEFARLRLSLASAVAEIRDRAPERPAVVLRDQTATPCAWGWVADGEYWLHFPGLAFFRFELGSRDVAGFAECGADSGAIRAEFHASVAPIVLQAAHGYEVLHGSGVLVAGRAVVGFCAVSRTGKSTIACGLSRRLCPLWADDLLAIEPNPADPTATVALPFVPRLTSESRRYLDERAQAEPLPQVTAGAKASLGALCILERRGADEDVAIDSLEPADALAAVLHHAYEFSPGPAERRIRMVRRYLDVCAEVPVFRLRFPPGLERLSGLLDAIEDIVVRAGA